MQCSVLNFHLIYLSGQQREKVTKTERFSQRERHEYRKAKGQTVQQKKKVGIKHIKTQSKRWIETLIERERATQCGMYISLPKDI